LFRISEFFDEILNSASIMSYYIWWQKGETRSSKLAFQKELKQLTLKRREEWGIEKGEQ